MNKNIQKRKIKRTYITITIYLENRTRTKNLKLKNAAKHRRDRRGNIKGDQKRPKKSRKAFPRFHDVLLFSTDSSPESSRLLRLLPSQICHRTGTSVDREQQVGHLPVGFVTFFGTVFLVPVLLFFVLLEKRYTLTCHHFSVSVQKISFNQFQSSFARFPIQSSLEDHIQI